MKPRSLLGITLELIHTVSEPGPYPADARVGRFFRERRFLGSKDRRFIGDATYAWLRHHHRGRLRWENWSGYKHCAEDLRTQLSEDPTSIHLLDILAMAHDERFPWDFRDTIGVAKELLDDEKRSFHELVREATGGGFPGDDAWPEDHAEHFGARVSLPKWSASRVLETYGEERGERIATALAEPAAVDVRVNLRRAKREKVRKSLSRELDLSIEPTHYSTLGLRIPERKNLTATTASKKGWIEVQDEGSQAVILSTDVSEGMTVIDACAGGGGKTLALADILFRNDENPGPDETTHKSRVLACDVEVKKLHELRRRAKDARLSEQIEYVRIGKEGTLESLLPKSHLVLVDAPCTGLGTLRRNPELKMRHQESDVAEFQELQLSILERFAPLVRARGRLVYVTCSILPEECEQVADAFEAAHPEFEPSPSYWAGQTLPSVAIDGHRVRLDPLTTETDAFFVASWRRSATSDQDQVTGKSEPETR